MRGDFFHLESRDSTAAELDDLATSLSQILARTSDYCLQTLSLQKCKYCRLILLWQK